MSLHPDVQNLAAQGRNGDSMLLHVTPDEVQGLHQLAQMHGAQMTINPATGLPEANFMKDWLPAILGGAAIVVTGGLAAPEVLGMEMGAGGMGAALGEGMGFSAGQAALTGAAVAGGTSLAVGNSFQQALGDAAITGGMGMMGGSLAQAETRGLAMQAEKEVAAEAVKRGVSKEVVLADQAALRNTTQASAEELRNSVQSQIQPRAVGDYGGSSVMPPISPMGPSLQYPQNTMGGLQYLGKNPGQIGSFLGDNKMAVGLTGAGLMAGMGGLTPKRIQPATAHGNYYSYPGFTQGYDPTGGASGQQYFNYSYGKPTLTPYAAGGSVDNTADDMMYPQSQLPSGAAGQYGNVSAVPVPHEVVGAQDAVVDPFTGAEGMAAGGIATLGGYSDGGRLTQGPGDGVSDSIPASIGGKQPARLADGEFVIPARIVSEIGNGSTKAGAKKLYAMMDRIQKARRKTKDIAANTRADRFMPA